MRNTILNVLNEVQIRELDSKHYLVCNIDFKIHIDKIITDNQYKDLDEHIHFDNIVQNIGEEKTTIDIYAILDDSIFDMLKSIIYNKEYKKVEYYKEMFVNSYLFDDLIIFSHCETECLFVKKCSEIYIVMNSNTKEKERQLLRIVREVLLRIQEDRAKCFYHSAVTSYKDKGILICGKSGAGKTTLLSYFMEKLKANFITNDRAFIYIKDNEVNVQYCPISIRVGIGTIRSTRKYMNYIKNCNLTRKQLFEVKKTNIEDMQNVFRDKVKYSLTSKEISNIFDVKLFEHTKLHCIIQSNIIKDFDGLIIEKIDKNDCEKLFDISCFTPFDEEWVNPWIWERKSSEEVLKENSRALKEKMVSQCDMIKVTYGTKTKKIKIVNSILKYIDKNNGRN